MSYHFNRLSVLVVEDNQPMQELMKSILQTFGVTNIFSAPDGQQGLQIYRARRPDIIITDWMMENMDGIEMTKKIRDLPLHKYPDVPIIMMTGQTDFALILEAREAGVTEFIAKPFSIDTLAKRFTEIIERPRSFVSTPSFKGPDRRRKTMPANSDIPMKRATDFEQVFIHA